MLCPFLPGVISSVAMDTIPEVFRSKPVQVTARTFTAYAIAYTACTFQLAGQIGAQSETLSLCPFFPPSPPDSGHPEQETETAPLPGFGFTGISDGTATSNSNSTLSTFASYGGSLSLNGPITSPR